MPTYEYHCTRCDMYFEMVQGMLDEHVAACPECGSSKTKRVFSIPATQVMTDSEFDQRKMGVPKARIDRTKELKQDLAKRKKDPQSERDLVSNELHSPAKTRRK